MSLTLSRATFQILSKMPRVEGRWGAPSGNQWESAQRPLIARIYIETYKIQNPMQKIKPIFQKLKYLDFKILRLQDFGVPWPMKIAVIGFIF